MSYDETAKKATIKYKKAKQHRIEVSWKNDDYESFILPAIERSGKPLATFIKEAVTEKIKRDGLD